MKALVIAIVLWSFNANAELKPKGTFIPSICGYSEHQTLCLGRKVGFSADFVSLYDGEALSIFQIVEKLPTHGGANPLIQAERWGIQDERQSGSIVIRWLKDNPYSSATVTFEDGASIVFTDFATVFTTF